MPHLFEPLSLRGVSLRNRIGVSPMCQYSAEYGFANDWHLSHYGARASGGAGLVIVEATAVEARGRISPNDLGIWSEEQVEPFARVVRFLRDYGAASAIQLAHAGRKAGTARPWDGGHPLSDADGGWDIVAPSPIAFDDHYRTPAQLTVEEIVRVQNAFMESAERAHRAGFDMVEIHGAHGYLIHSFHSPISNQRTDEYGGSFDNRVRFTLETVAAVRTVWPEKKPLAVRLSCTDWVDGGWTLDESIALAQRLKPLGVDLIDCSSGGAAPHVHIPAGAGYQVPFAEAIRTEADIPTAAVGMITQAQQADQIIRNGRADITLLAREMLRNPTWPLAAAAELGQSQAALAPAQYRRAYGS